MCKITAITACCWHNVWVKTRKERRAKKVDLPSGSNSEGKPCCSWSPAHAPPLCVPHLFDCAPGLPKSAQHQTHSRSFKISWEMIISLPDYIHAGQCSSDTYALSSMTLKCVLANARVQKNYAIKLHTVTDA
jgi:hypothetical protein